METSRDDGHEDDPVVSTSELLWAIERQHIGRIAVGLMEIDDLTDEVIPRLISLLRHPDSLVVFETIECLARFDVRTAMNEIWRCKGRHDDLVRVAQAEAAWTLNDTGHERNLRWLLSDASPMVRGRAALAYATLYPECARQRLPKLLRREPNPHNHVNLVLGIYTASPKAGLELILACLDHEEAVIRQLYGNSFTTWIRPEDRACLRAAIESHLDQEADAEVRATLEYQRSHLQDPSLPIEVWELPSEERARQRQAARAAE